MTSKFLRDITAFTLWDRDKGKPPPRQAAETVQSVNYCTWKRQIDDARLKAHVLRHPGRFAK